MRSFFAVFDPHHRDGSILYWPCSHAELTARLLEHFYYRVAEKDLSAAPWKLDAQIWRGGWASIDEEWCAIYRFFDGGRDPQGRLGRFVIGVAFYRKQETERALPDPISVVIMPPFEDLARHSPIEWPVPCPGVLEIELDLLGKDVLTGDTSTVKRKGPEESITAPMMMDIAARNANEADFFWKIRQDRDGVAITGGATAVKSVIESIVNMSSAKIASDRGSDIRIPPVRETSPRDMQLPMGHRGWLAHLISPLRSVVPQLHREFLIGVVVGIALGGVTGSYVTFCVVRDNRTTKRQSTAGSSMKELTDTPPTSKSPPKSVNGDNADEVTGK